MLRNRPKAGSDDPHMRCEQWRIILSAQLDGEVTLEECAAVEGHLRACADCRRWRATAVEATRRVRIQDVTSVPDLIDTILAAHSADSALRSGRPAALARPPVVLLLRAALGIFGALQLVLGLAQIAQSIGHLHISGQHLWHESAAWNVAVGVGFVCVALRRTRPAGMVPMLTVLVVTLTLLSINDIITGQVAGQRLMSHGFLLAGYVAILLLSRSGRPYEGPFDHRPMGPRGQMRLDEQGQSTPPLRLLPPPAAG